MQNVDYAVLFYCYICLLHIINDLQYLFTNISWNIMFPNKKYLL